MIQEELVNDVRRLFEDDCTGHDFFHTLRVVNLARYIALREGADAEITELAALLHDTDDVKLFKTGSNNAESLMVRYGYSDDIKKQVKEIISNLSFGGNGRSTPFSLEGKIVQDADRLDAMGAVGIARAFAYGGSKGRKIHDPNIVCIEDMTEEQYRSKYGTTINHFYEKLLRIKDLMNTDTAKEIAEVRHERLVRFLEEFYSEWNGES